jgi:hypothetical protein
VERPVLVAVFDRGELQSVRTLSPERERSAAILAATGGAVLVLLAMALAAGLVKAFGLVVHAPTFFLSWLGVAGAVAIASARWVRERVGRYRLGADMEADAFAMAEVDLVRRVGDEYQIGICPGMSGVLEHARSTTPLESFTRHGVGTLALPHEGKVRVEIGTSTFVITRRRIGARQAAPLRERLGWLASGPLRRLVRATAVGIPVAVAATLLGSVPAALAVTDLDQRFAIPRNATPVEAERLIHARAQFETQSLHQCFDPLPLSCHRPGFVGVGVALSRDGEVLRHWISRSTYDEADCPVTSCMEKVVAGWTFSPMRERMNVVLPIQVKRTRRPLALQQRVMIISPREAEPILNAANATGSGEIEGGSGCMDWDSGAVPAAQEN